MTKHQEFLTKLKELMEEYNAEISFDYYESGCECCGDTYEAEITAGGESTTSYSSEINPWSIGRLSE